MHKLEVICVNGKWYMDWMKVFIHPSSADSGIRLGLNIAALASQRKNRQLQLI